MRRGKRRRSWPAPSTGAETGGAPAGAPEDGNRRACGSRGRQACPADRRRKKMSDKMTPMPFGKMMEWILEEHEKGSIFGIRKFFKADPQKHYEIFGRRTR